MTHRRGFKRDGAPVQLEGFAKATYAETDRVPGVETTLGAGLGARRKDQNMAVVGIGTRANRVFIVGVRTEVRPSQVGEGKLALGGGGPDDDQVLQF